MTLEVIDPCVSPEWMELVDTHPDASIFHHPQWLMMLRDMYGYGIFAVCVRDGSRIIAAIPFADVKSLLTGRRWVSLPFSDYCMPLLDHSAPAATDLLAEYLWQKHRNGIPKIEMRWDVPAGETAFHVQDFVMHRLPLGEGSAIVEKGFRKKSVRHSLAKAGKVGVTVWEGKTEADLDTFFALQVNTRKRLGVPVQPHEFFRAVWGYMIMKGLGFLLIAGKDGQPMASNLYFTWRDTVYYKYGATDFRFKEFCPSHAVMNEAIRRAMQEGFTTFDFGRSDIDGEGLRNYKSGWGGIETPLTYTLITDEAPTGGASWKKNAIGAVIKRSPEFVCKLSGKLLYKHFA